MDCVLFRHGIAVDREDWDREDADRPLTPKGAARTREAAAGLLWLDVAPTHILASPYLRAQETAKVVREAMRLKAEIKVCEELRPEAPPDKLLAVLATMPEKACVLCVGHEPHLGEAAGVMLFGKPAAGLFLKKAGGCLIRFEGVPKAGRGQLAWWLGPGPLRRLGG